MIGDFQPRKLLETAKCDAEDTQALAVSLNNNSSPSNLNTSSLSGVTCDITLCLALKYVSTKIKYIHV